MFSLRIHALITAGLFAAIPIAPWCLSAAQSAFPSPAVFESTVKVVVFVLFLACGYSAVPLMIKLFVAGQRGIGNAAVAPIAWLEAHEVAVVVGVWLFFSLGVAIAAPAAISAGFFGPSGQAGATVRAEAPSQVLLIAAPGMTVDEMFRRSSLVIDDGGSRRRDLPVYASGAVFDYQPADPGLILSGCRYYYISTYLNDPHRIEAVNIGLSPAKTTLAGVDAADAALRARLASAGWAPGHEVYRDEEDQRLHGGLHQGPEGRLWLKHDVVLAIERQRMDDPAPGEDAATAGEWIQYIALWQRADYPNIDRYDFGPPAQQAASVRLSRHR